MLASKEISSDLDVEKKKFKHEHTRSTLEKLDPSNLDSTLKIHKEIRSSFWNIYQNLLEWH